MFKVFKVFKVRGSVKANAGPAREQQAIAACGVGDCPGSQPPPHRDDGYVLHGLDGAAVLCDE
jgi:hypothetical protein